MCCTIWGYIHVRLENAFVANGCCRVDSVLTVHAKSTGTISAHCLRQHKQECLKIAPRISKHNSARMFLGFFLYRCYAYHNEHNTLLISVLYFFEMQHIAERYILILFVYWMYSNKMHDCAKSRIFLRDLRFLREKLIEWTVY